MFKRIKEFFKRKSEEKKLQEQFQKQRADELEEFLNSHREEIKRFDEIQKQLQKDYPFSCGM